MSQRKSGLKSLNPLLIIRAPTFSAYKLAGSKTDGRGAIYLRTRRKGALMLWIIVAAVVIFLAFGAAGLRTALKVAVVLVIAAIVLIAGYLFYDKAEQTASKTRISSSEIQFDDLRLATGSSELTGAVRNRSQRYTLSSVDMQVTLRDCVGQACDVVGESTARLWGLNVPPGQVRAVNAYVSFPNLPPRRGEYRWEYRIKTVEADR